MSDEDMPIAMRVGRMLGMIEGIQNSLLAILAAQETARKEASEHRREVYLRLDMLSERLGAVERGTDTVEGHGAALVDLERRVADAETRRAAAEQQAADLREFDRRLRAIEARHHDEEVVRKTGRRWGGLIFTALGAIGAVAGNKIVKFVGSIFGGK